MNTSKTCAATFQCSSNIGCASDREICDKAECSSALNRVYKVIIKDASLNYTPNSADGDFSSPDPYVNVYFPNINTLAGTTSSITDTLKPFWNQYVEVTVTADGQSIWFCMQDSDQPFSADDPLYFVGSSCMGFDNILSYIKVGEASISGNADVNYLNVSIEPK